jgi:hypothetical protein
MQPLSAGREERYRQNDLLPLISYQHHQAWIVVANLLPQALDCTLRVGKCRRFVQQKCAVGIVLFSSVRPPDGEKISGHCYLIETCPHAREASYTQSMKVTCRDCANACLGGAVTEPAWKSKPSWYLQVRDDKMIPYPAQQFMAKRAVAEAPGSHAIYVSNPKAVAELIEQAASGIK